MSKEDEWRAKQQAKAQLESIMLMTKRLDHAQSCSGDDCELSDKDIIEGLNLLYQEGQKATEEERKEYHDEEAAKQAIQEDALEVQIRSGWHTPGESGEEGEYYILLCTGGPACRIIGDLTDHDDPDSAILQYQDWFTPWIDYNCSEEDKQALLNYAREFYFGES